MTILPPPQYDFPPTLAVIEYVLAAPVVNERCWAVIRLKKAEAPPTWWALAVAPGAVFGGCTFAGPKGCLIIRIDDAKVARHERAHCNGWPNDHRGGHE